MCRKSIWAIKEKNDFRREVRTKINYWPMSVYKICMRGGTIVYQSYGCKTNADLRWCMQISYPYNNTKH